MVEPVTTILTGIALVQKSVDFVKSNIDTINDIKSITSLVEDAIAGEQQIQKERFQSKSIIGQTKSAAETVIDAKLAQEQLAELQILIDNRFGFGTYRQIVKLRNDRIKEEKERQAEQARMTRQKRQQTIDNLQTIGIGLAIALALGVGLLVLMTTRAR